MKRFALLIVAGLSLAACETTGGTVTQNAAGPAWLSIVNKTLVNGDQTISLRSTGKIVGKGLEGVWTERNGQFCRTLTKPKRFAGTECQVVTLDGDQVTFDNQKGRTITWIVR